MEGLAMSSRLEFDLALTGVTERNERQLESESTCSTELADNESSENNNVPRAQPTIEFEPTSLASVLRTPRIVSTGIYTLYDVDQVEIQRIVDMSSLLGVSRLTKQYRVKVPNAQSLFLVMETEDKHIPLKFSLSRGFTLCAVDSNGETALLFMKSPVYYWQPHTIMVSDRNNVIGSIQQNFGVLGQTFTVFNRTMESICEIVGPKTCGCCMFKESQFQVISQSGNQIASIMHEWSRQALDYTYLLTFSNDTDINTKILLIGTALLMDFLYFNKVK